MGVHAQHQQANNSCSLLCVWCDATHHVSNTTGRTRVQHTTQRNTNNHTHQGIQLSTQTTRRPILLASCADHTSSQLEAWSQPNSRRNNSKNSTSHTDSNRHGSPSQQEWPMEESTGQHARHRSCQTADVQFQQKGWRITEEQSYKDQTTTQKSSKKHTKTSTRSNRRGLYKETTGQERHGSKWNVEQYFQATYHHNQHFHQPKSQRHHLNKP